MNNQTNGKSKQKFHEERIVGNGTFGVVYQSKDPQTGEIVAIKKVFQDQRYKNRELQMMQDIKEHPNVIQLRSFYYSHGNDPKEVYLHLIMDFVPETMYKLISYFCRQKQGTFPSILVKAYSYQLLRSLAYIHGIGICHRDIKPSNVLVDPRNHNLKLCDFGSAKKLVRGEPNISYICSRYYRAPELMYGATQYTNQIDVWSTGCVIAEMMLGTPIFAGETSVDQLIEIIKVLGTPNKQDLFEMNPEHTPQKNQINIKPRSWKKVFKGRQADPEIVDLVANLLTFSPVKRLKPLEALLHPCFNEIKQEDFKINGRAIEDLFGFLEEEIRSGKNLLPFLIPEWYKKQQEMEN